jgi:hypothetical protein
MHHGRAGVQDIKNSMIAGGIVGVLSELPVLFRSMVITRSDMMAMEQGLPLIRPRPRFLTNAAGKWTELYLILICTNVAQFVDKRTFSVY